MRGEKCLLTPDGNESRQPDLASRWQNIVRRRSFLHGVAGVAAGAALPATKLFADNNRLTKGDAALLRFAATAEFIETDLWQQYNELGGAVDHNDNPNPGNPAYVAALQQLDGDMPQYISDNTDDEISHRDFLNAYLQSRGAAPVDFTQFETLQGSTAMGSANKGRLTNLKTLNVDTSWYFRYRSTQNPDLGVNAITERRTDSHSQSVYCGQSVCRAKTCIPGSPHGSGGRCRSGEKGRG